MNIKKVYDTFLKSVNYVHGLKQLIIDIAFQGVVLYTCIISLHDMKHVLNHALDQLQNFLFYRNGILAAFYGAALALHIGMWGIFFANLQTIYQPTKEVITLHYKVGIGPDFVGPWYMILAVPLFGLIVLVLNCAVSRSVYHSERFSAHALAVSTIAIQAVLAWVLYLTIKANLF